MNTYSEFFTTLHDESAPEGTQGTHYSVLQALVWVPQMSIHDFAVIWDRDHDSRIIWVAEQLYVRLLLHSVLFIGESESRVTILTAGVGTNEFEVGLKEICDRVPSYCSDISVGVFRSSCGYITHESNEVAAYLEGINILWSLGTREAAGRDGTCSTPMG